MPPIFIAEQTVTLRNCVFGFLYLIFGRRRMGWFFFEVGPEETGEQRCNQPCLPSRRVQPNFSQPMDFSTVNAGPAGGAFGAVGSPAPAAPRTPPENCEAMFFPLGGDGPSGPRMDDSDGMGCERSFTPFKTHLAVLQLMSKHFIEVRDDS